MIFYVYVYLNPRKPGHYVYGEYGFDYEPFYIGKGKNGRAYVHLNEYGKNKKFLCMIQEIKTPNIIFYKEGMSENEALSLERKMIKTIGRLDKNTGPLFNKNDGGGGCSNPVCSDELRKKRSEARKGFVFSEETKQKIREKRKLQVFTEETRKKMRKKHNIEEKTREKMRERAQNRTYSKETRLKISKAGCGRVHSEETKQKMRQKALEREERKRNENTIKEVANEAVIRGCVKHIENI